MELASHEPWGRCEAGNAWIGVRRNMVVRDFGGMFRPSPHQVLADGGRAIVPLLLRGVLPADLHDGVVGRSPESHRLDRNSGLTRRLVRHGYAAWFGQDRADADGLSLVGADGRDAVRLPDRRQRRAGPGPAR